MVNSIVEVAEAEAIEAQKSNNFNNRNLNNALTLLRRLKTDDSALISI
ncbi:MAG: hypothetical protein ACRD8Z_14490 [Nitrososphaeraceae archaeon]